MTGVIESPSGTNVSTGTDQFADVLRISLTAIASGSVPPTGIGRLHYNGTSLILTRDDSSTVTLGVISALAGVLAEGNTTGGNNIVFTGTDTLRFARGNNLIVDAATVATADRTLTLPDPLGPDSFVYEGLAQTLASKTLTTPTIASFVNATHDHQAAAGGGTLPTAAPSSVGTANAAGSATTIARTDHVHDHGSQSTGTHHAAVIAAGASGFMVGADKTKLNGIEALAEVTSTAKVNSAGAVMETDYTAKGDVLAASAASTPAVVSVGTDGQVYTADAASATGTKWADAAGGGLVYFTQVVGTTNGAGIDDTGDVDQLCDGTADEVQIQAAIAALPAQGGTVLIRRGDYILASTLTITQSNVILEGEGRGATTITGPAANQLLLINNAAVADESNIRISGITFIDGQTAAAGNHCIEVKRTNNFTVENCEFRGSPSTFEWQAIEWTASGGTGFNLKIRNNRFQNCGAAESTFGVLIVGSSTQGVKVLDNDWEDCVACVRYDGVNTGVIANNTVTDNGSQPFSYISSSSANISVNDNTVKTSGDGGLTRIRTSSNIDVSDNIIEITGSDNNAVVTISDSSNTVHLSGNTIDGQRFQVSVASNVTNVKIEDNLFKDFTVMCLVLDGQVQVNNNHIFRTGGVADIGITLSNANTSRSTVVGNLIENLLLGIDVDAADDVAIRDNLFDGCTTAIDIAATCDDTQVTDNSSVGVTTDLTDAGIGTIVRGNSWQHGFLIVTTTPVTAGDDEHLLVDASGGVRTINLPAAALKKKQYYSITKTDAVANNVTVDANLSETIGTGGATTQVLAAQGDMIRIVSDGSNWHIVADTR